MVQSKLDGMHSADSVSAKASGVFGKAMEAVATGKDAPRVDLNALRLEGTRFSHIEQVGSVKDLPFVF